MQQQMCLARHPRTRTRFDIVSWLAGIIVVALVALFVLPQVTGWFGHPLPGRVVGKIGSAIWWLYWASVVSFGLVVIQRWRNTYFRWRTLATMVSQTLFGIILIGPLSGVLHIPPFWRRLHLTWPLHMSVITPYLERTLLSAFVYGVIVSLIAWPLITHFVGMRYCSWFCFCGTWPRTWAIRFAPRAPRARSANPWTTSAMSSSPSQR